MGKLLAANSAKAQEKVLSLGTWRADIQPQSLRNVASAASLSIRLEVVGRLKTVLAIKARAKA